MFACAAALLSTATQSPLLVVDRSSPNDSIAIMFNSIKKQKTSTRKTSNARGPYREFNDATKSMRDILVRGYAEQYIENVAANKNGRCSYGFVANLVQEAASVAEVLKISNRDIENEAARIMVKRREVSPESSGTLQASSTTVDEIDDTPGGNVIQASVGLNLLARAASEPRPLPPVAAASVEPTIPNDDQNKCSHRNCFLPFVPSTCCTMGCDGTVHSSRNPTLVIRTSSGPSES